MTFESKTHDLMAAVGPALDLLAVDEYTAEGLWHIAIDETNILFAELDRSRQVLVLSADLGAPKAGSEAKLYALMLQYNHCWERNAGARLSIVAPGGTASLAIDLVVDHIDAGQFAHALQAFAERAATWRDIVSRAGNDTVAAPSPTENEYVIRG